MHTAKGSKTMEPSILEDLRRKDETVMKTINELKLLLADMKKEANDASVKSELNLAEADKKLDKLEDDASVSNEQLSEYMKKYDAISDETDALYSAVDKYDSAYSKLDDIQESFKQ